MVASHHQSTQRRPPVARSLGGSHRPLRRLRVGPAFGRAAQVGRRLNLPDQPLQILTALLERPGELVTRDELRQRLWAEDTFVDFEHGLNAAVKRLRDVLGDSADTPRFIETVPKRGYRFVAPVDRDGDRLGVGSTDRSIPRHSARTEVVGHLRATPS